MRLKSLCISILYLIGLFVDSRRVCCGVRIPCGRSGLCGPLWGRHGFANHTNWYTILPSRRRVEEQTKMGAARDWCVQTNIALLLSLWLYRSDLGNRVEFGIKNKALFTFYVLLFMNLS